MTTAKRDIEVKAQTVEAAVEAGLAQLGLSRGDVIVDVIDEGSRGILGLGAREAVVRLVSMAPTAVPPPTPQPKSPKPEPARVEKRHTPPPREEAKKGITAAAPVASPEELERERQAALEILHTLLGQMQIEAQITADLTEPDDISGRQINLINITGQDLGVLIGPRGETLSALQYITRLMAGHHIKERADFIIDIEGYRERRKQALARLAERMADKVIKQGRPVTLEPMPAHERRVIHMTLRDADTVYTQSSGEGSRRRVRILPK